MNRNELLCQMRTQIEFSRRDLANRCRLLSDRMIYIARELDREILCEDLTINNRGEVQSQGTIIDAECGRLTASIEFLRFAKELE